MNTIHLLYMNTIHLLYMNMIQLYLNQMNAIHLFIRMPKQKKFVRNKEEKIEEIVHQFLDLINEMGFTHIKMLDIANRTHISVGTIYRYFPNGKISILQFLLEEKFYDITDFSGFAQMDNANLDIILERMIYQHLHSHYNEISYHIAINQAILSNKEFQTNYNKHTSLMMQKVSKTIQNSNEYLKRIPENVFLTNMLLIFNTLESFIHRHLFIRPIFPTDEELVHFLKKIILDLVLK